MGARRIDGLAAQGVPAAPPARPPRHRAVEGEPAPRRRCGPLRRGLHEVLHKHLSAHALLMLFSNEELSAGCSRGPGRPARTAAASSRGRGRASAKEALRAAETWPARGAAQAPLHMLFSNEELTGRCASRVPARHRNVLDGAGRAPGADQALRPRSARPTSSSATANMVMQMVAAAQAERAAAAAAAAAAAESSDDED